MNDLEEPRGELPAPEIPASPDKLIPWLTIWYKPKATILQMMDKPISGYLICFIATVCGVIFLLDLARTFHLGDRLSLNSILLISILAGIPFGFISLYGQACILTLFGMLLKGKAKLEHLFLVSIWGSMPTIATALYWAIVIIKDGITNFQTPDIASNTPSGLWSNSYITIFESLAVFFIMICGIVAVQRFSYLRAFINLLATTVVVFIFLISTFTYVLVWLLANHLIPGK